MNCERIQPELISYHFGVVENGLRREIEEHLVACPDCLRSFLALKREIETAESRPRPSPAVRHRLRVSAARELGLEPRPWSWWERPLAFGFAGAVTLVAIMQVIGSTNGPVGAPPYGLFSPSVSTRPAEP